MKKLSYERKKSFAGWVFISIWVIGFIYYFIIPFIYAFIFSVSEISYGNGMMLKYKGFGYYFSVIKETPAFIRALYDSFMLIFWQIPLVTVFSIFMAILLNAKFRGRAAFRTLFFLPVIIASGMLITLLSTSSGFGGAMSSATTPMFSGIKFQDFLVMTGFPNEVVTQIMSIVNGIFGVVWRSGVQILLFLAGLQAIPASLYEAARVEGATGWEIFWKITFPLISPTTILCIFFTIVDMSNDSSISVVNYIRLTVKKAQFSTSSTMSIIWFFVIGILAGLIFFFTRKHIYYMDDKG